MTLEQLFQLAELFQLAYAESFSIDTSSAFKQLKLSVKLLEGLRQESFEAQQHLGILKNAWAGTSAETEGEGLIAEIDCYLEELADIQLMLLAILYWSGFNSEQFADAIKAKLIKNANRPDHNLSIDKTKLEALFNEHN